MEKSDACFSRKHSLHQKPFCYFGSKPRFWCYEQQLNQVTKATQTIGTSIAVVSFDIKTKLHRCKHIYLFVINTAEELTQRFIAAELCQNEDVLSSHCIYGSCTVRHLLHYQ